MQKQKNPTINFPVPNNHLIFAYKFDTNVKYKSKISEYEQIQYWYRHWFNHTESGDD